MSGFDMPLSSRLRQREVCQRAGSECTEKGRSEPGVCLCLMAADQIDKLSAALRAAPEIPFGMLKPDAAYQLRTGEWFEDYIQWQFDHQVAAFVKAAGKKDGAATD